MNAYIKQYNQIFQKNVLLGDVLSNLQQKHSEWLDLYGEKCDRKEVDNDLAEALDMSWHKIFNLQMLAQAIEMQGRNINEFAIGFS